MYGIIYIALNKINNKVYIGQTTMSLIKRKTCHYSSIKENKRKSYFYNALRKYNKINWEWKILQYAYCKEELDALEKYWMWILDTMNSKKGYNTKEGGANGKLTKRTIQKMSEAKKRKNLSKETLQKMSKAHKGKNNGFYGKHHTEEYKKILSKKMKGKYINANNPNAKTIICVENNKKYGSISEAARNIGIKSSTISIVLNKHKGHQTAGGYHWVFV